MQGPRVGVRAGDLKTARTARPLHGRGHHSLVTPIDWKPFIADGENVDGIHGHHSLVTPIDWKLKAGDCIAICDFSHHSLVTPIDWKQFAHDLITCQRIRSPLAGDTY